MCPHRVQTDSQTEGTHMSSRGSQTIFKHLYFGTFVQETEFSIQPQNRYFTLMPNPKSLPYDRASAIVDWYVLKKQQNC